MSSDLLEGDVVVGGLGREVGSVRLRRTGGNELAAPSTTVAVVAAAEELDVVGDDLDCLALARAVGRLPLTPLEPTVDRDRAALGEVLRAALALGTPHRHVEVVRLVRPLARLVLAARVHRDAERAQCRA